MHHTRAGIERDVVAQINRRKALVAGIKLCQRVLKRHQAQGLSQAFGNDFTFHAPFFETVFDTLGSE